MLACHCIRECSLCLRSCLILSVLQLPQEHWHVFLIVYLLILFEYGLTLIIRHCTGSSSSCSPLLVDSLVLYVLYFPPSSNTPLLTVLVYLAEQPRLVLHLCIKLLFLSVSAPHERIVLEIWYISVYIVFKVDSLVLLYSLQYALPLLLLYAFPLVVLF